MLLGLVAPTVADASAPATSSGVDASRSGAAYRGSSSLPRVSNAVATSLPPSVKRLDVSLLRFDLRGDPWVRGEAVFDLTLTLTGGEQIAHRLTVRTSELMTDDDDLAWTQTAAKLARWSAVEIARWARGATAS